MFSILIIIFSFKFINYFINNINYNKNINISKTNNNIQNPKTQEPRASAMTQALGVPKWGTGMAHSQHTPSATGVLGCPAPRQTSQAPRGRRGLPNTEEEPKRHLCAWFASTQVSTQASHVRYGCLARRSPSATLFLYMV